METTIELEWEFWLSPLPRCISHFRTLDFYFFICQMKGIGYLILKVSSKSCVSAWFYGPLKMKLNAIKQLGNLKGLPGLLGFYCQALEIKQKRPLCAGS